MISTAGSLKHFKREFTVFSVRCQRAVYRRDQSPAAESIQVSLKFGVGICVTPRRNLDKPGATDLGVTGFAKPPTGVQFRKFCVLITPPAGC